jgi:Lar family restriction alleviation protein
MLEVEIMKLLNCPFCGSDEVTCIEGVSISWVICVKCGADGPVASTSVGAIRKWNERIKEEEK